MYPTGQSPPLRAQKPIVKEIPQNLLNVVEHQRGQSIYNGSFQIIVGILCIIVNFDSSFRLIVGRIDQGFLGGVFYIVTGSLGIVAGKKMTKSIMMAHTVLCIIAASLVAPGHFTISVIAAVTPRKYELGDYSESGRRTSIEDRIQLEENFYYSGLCYISLIQAVLVAIEFGFAVWGSTIWCKAGGCCSDQQAMAAVQAVKRINEQPIIFAYGPGCQLVPVVIQQPQCPSYPMPSPPSYADLEKKY